MREFEYLSTSQLDFWSDRGAVHQDHGVVEWLVFRDPALRSPVFALSSSFLLPFSAALHLSNHHEKRFLVLGEMFLCFMSLAKDIRFLRFGLSTGPVGGRSYRGLRIVLGRLLDEAKIVKLSVDGSWSGSTICLFVR